MIDPRQLRAFVTVAQTAHFGRAADMLHLAQSAVSSQVQRLEEQVGALLLHRGKRAAVSLTDAGRLFLPEALSLLRQLERVDRIGRSIGRGEIGQIDLGYVASAVMCGLLPKLLGEFRTAFPAVAVSVVSMDTPTQLKALTEGLIDIGLVRSRHTFPDDIHCVSIHQEPLHIALPAGDPLTQYDEVPASGLLNRSFIMPQFGEEPGFADFLRRLGKVAGGTFDPLIRVTDFVSAISLVAAGYGVVLIPSSFRRLQLQNVEFRPIRNYRESVELTLAFRRFEPSASVNAFIAAACKAHDQGGSQRPRRLPKQYR